MNHASVFSGIGGAEIAAHHMGWKNCFHCEIAEFPRRVLSYWFPNSVSYEDITKTDFTPWKGKIDVLTGGFPCQPFSFAGKRKGAGDDRYLWPQMLRVISEIKPTWVVGENVAGIKTMVEPSEEVEMGRTDYLFEENYLYRKEERFTLERICEDLEAEGYSVQPLLIPACSVGAPHRRDRIWIVAHRSDAGLKAMQQDGKDGVSSARPLACSNSLRPRLGKNEQKSIPRCRKSSNLSSRRKKRITPHFHEYRNRSQQKSEATQRIGRRDIFQQEERRNQTKWADRLSQFLQSSSLCDWEETDCQWKDFPTESPVCCGNDGIPFDVDRLTISFAKWRQESIKAFGNAWVPQVAYEIFRAIQAVETF